MIYSFTIDWMGRPHLANAERRANHFQSAKIRKEWNEATVQACRINKVPKGLTRIGLHIQPTYDKLPLPDPDAPFPTAKAILDGLVAHGTIPDDNGTYVAYVCCLAPILDRDSPTGIRVAVVSREDLGG